MNTQGEKNSNWKARQGDVLLRSITEMPVNAKEVKREARGIVLAEGTASKHWHGIRSMAAKLFATDDGARYLNVVEPVTLAQESANPNDTEALHHSIEIPVGVYGVSIHQEYAPGELPRQVQD